MDLSNTTLDYLHQRAERYGGDAAAILAITPPHLNTDDEVLAFWQEKDLSHVQSQANAPHLAGDWSNIIPEDADANRSRGPNNMSLLEAIHTQLDNQLDALLIELHQD